MDNFNRYHPHGSTISYYERCTGIPYCAGELMVLTTLDRKQYYDFKAKAMTATFSDDCCVQVQRLPNSQVIIGYADNSAYMAVECTSHVRNSPEPRTLRVTSSNKVDKFSTWVVPGSEYNLVYWQKYFLSYNFFDGFSGVERSNIADNTIRLALHFP